MPELLKFKIDTDIIEQELRDADHSIFERGKGNVCSAEVNPFLSKILRGITHAKIVQLSLSLACND
jgi:hypothetical protein